MTHDSSKDVKNRTVKLLGGEFFKKMKLSMKWGMAQGRAAHLRRAIISDLFRGWESNPHTAYVPLLSFRRTSEMDAGGGFAPPTTCL